MATGWAVSASFTLGLVVAGLLALGLPDDAAGRIVMALLAAMLVAGWAFGIARAAHGSKGSLVGLAVDAALIGVVLSLLALRGTDVAGTRALLLGTILVALGAIASIVIEIRSRRGKIPWGDAIFVTLPSAIYLAVRVIVGV